MSSAKTEHEQAHKSTISMGWAEWIRDIVDTGSRVLTHAQCLSLLKLVSPQLGHGYTPGACRGGAARLSRVLDEIVASKAEFMSARVCERLTATANEETDPDARLCAVECLAALARAASVHWLRVAIATAVDGLSARFASEMGGHNSHDQSAACGGKVEDSGGGGSEVSALPSYRGRYLAAMLVLLLRLPGALGEYTSASSGDNSDENVWRRQQRAAASYLRPCDVLELTDGDVDAAVAAVTCVVHMGHGAASPPLLCAAMAVLSSFGDMQQFLLEHKVRAAIVVVATAPRAGPDSRFGGVTAGRRVRNRG